MSIVPFHERDRVRAEKWLLQIRRGKPLAVILGSTLEGLTFIRSLGRRNIPTLQMDSDRNEAMYTRFGESCVLPPLDLHASEWLLFLEFLGKRLDKPGVVFAASESHVLFLSRNRQEIARHFRFLIPGTEVVEQIVNKRSQYTVAERAGITIPKTAYPESVADVRSWAKDICYPSILKPYTYQGRGVIGGKALLLHSPLQLTEEYSRVSDSGQKFMVQEVIPGGWKDIFAYHGFWDGKGKEKAWWTKRHLRGTPFGNSSFHVTVDAPEVAALSRKLLSAFSYGGFSNVEFKLDPRDRKYCLMEINARTGQTSQQGVSAGIDFPWIAYCELTGAGIPEGSPPPFKQGVTHVDESVDLELWRTGEISFVSWAKTLITAHAKSYWNWKDPGPLLACAGSSARSSARENLMAFLRILPAAAWLFDKLASLYRYRRKPEKAHKCSMLASEIRQTPP